MVRHPAQRLVHHEPADVTAMLADSLNTLLADVITFYLAAHGCHWNTEGPDFYEYHGLFEDIYSDVYGSVDPLAENIRKLGEYALFNLGELEQKRSLRISGTSTAPKAMARMLQAANQTLIESIRQCFHEAEAGDEQAIANFLAERMDRHQQWAWMLTASLKEA